MLQIKKNAHCEERYLDHFCYSCLWHYQNTLKQTNTNFNRNWSHYIVVTTLSYKGPSKFDKKTNNFFFCVLQFFGWTGSVSDPDPYPVGTTFNLGLDPESGSVFGFWIQMYKNRFEKPKFTITYSIFNLKDENRKMQLSWNFNHSSLSLFQELITLGNFFFSCTV
jgi:hypothetical protein